MFIISVVVGSITDQVDCDGVVNAANKNLRAGSGVCGAIYRAAGPRLEPYSVQFAPLEVGEALATPAFDMGCRFIIHALGPKYLFDPDPPTNLAKAVRSAVLLADQNGIKKLAIPAISTGVYGYPPEEAVPILVETVMKFQNQLKTLEELRFVVLGSEMKELFDAAIAKERGTTEN